MSEPVVPLDVLVVDDEESMRSVLEIVLKNEGFQVRTVGSGEEALAVVREAPPKVFLQDMRMGGIDGMELLKRVRALSPRMPVIVMTAYSSWDTAVEAMRLGAFDYLKKPCDTDHIRSVIQRALVALEHDTVRDRPARQIIGNTPSMQRIYEVVKRIAPTDSTVLIQGESGSGKELVARSVHAHSHRSRKPFLAINCSAFNENLLESELFGHVKGSFTGAVENRKGVFESADGGTLFLDEVAEMSTSTQVRMLRVLEDRKVVPLGTSTEMDVNVRIIAATHKELEREVANGRFREDLFYRLNVIPVRLPPLRDRCDDIPMLAGHFLAVHSRNMNKDVVRLSERAKSQLMNYGWPGNVRELDNVIQRHVALCTGDCIDSFELDAGQAPVQRGVASERSTFDIPEQGFVLEDVLDGIERNYLLSALDRTGGNLTQAAKILGMSYRSIRYKVKKLNVKFVT